MWKPYDPEDEVFDALRWEWMIADEDGDSGVLGRILFAHPEYACALLEFVTAYRRLTWIEENIPLEPISPATESMIERVMEKFKKKLAETVAC